MMVSSATHDLVTCSTCKILKRLLGLLESYDKICVKVGHARLTKKIEDKKHKYRGEFFDHLESHFERIDEEEKQKEGELRK